ncbi:unnamed protein product [Linum trigynum]|uniref:Uncharacterized protein n=1 Tax=Linum trigynum TaxID=586398 RepID=A0AAV2G920_9ROSI
MEAVNSKGSSSSLSRRRRSYISNSCCRALLCFVVTIIFFYSDTLSSPGIRCPFSASHDLHFQVSTLYFYFKFNVITLSLLLQD